jgi:hypothetical protein
MDFELVGLEAVCFGETWDHNAGLVGHWHLLVVDYVFVFVRSG